MGEKNSKKENAQTKMDEAPNGDMTGNVLGRRSQLNEGNALKWYPAETDVSIRPGWFYHESEDTKVKTPEYLKEIYFHSVGRNGVLLLNIPPNKRGLISEYDVNALKKWKLKLDSIFERNLAKNAKFSENITNAKQLFDGNDTTYYEVTINGKDNFIEFELDKAHTINVLLLQENISIGQRVEKFVLEYWSNGEWKKVVEGTTIGYKRLLEFPVINARKLRLIIAEARLQPALAEIGLFWDKNHK